MEDFYEDKKYKFIKEFRSGERPPKDLKAQKAQFYRHVYYPRKNAIVQIIRDNPAEILADRGGRLYGLMPKNPVLDDLMKSSSFDPRTMIEVWVLLPNEKRGLFTDRSRKRKRYLSQGEVLKLPDVGDKITLYDYLTEKRKADAVVHSFPEKIFRNAKSAALILRVETFYDSKKKE